MIAPKPLRICEIDFMQERNGVQRFQVSRTHLQLFCADIINKVIDGENFWGKEASADFVR